MAKAFVDYLPDWVAEIDLADPANYNYAHAVRVFGQRMEAQRLYPQGRDWGYWVVDDKLKIEPQRRFLCYRNSEFPRWTPDIVELFDRCEERTEVDPVIVDGKTYFRFRFSTGVAVLEPYAPRSPDKIDEGRRKLAQKKRLQELDSLALFADEVRAEQETES